MREPQHRQEEFDLLTKGTLGKLLAQVEDLF